MYNHVYMALPTLKNQGDALQKEVLSFLWTRQVDGNTVGKRRLVAKNRIAASHSMGGLQVQHPAEHAGSLQLNLIQKIYQDTRNNQRKSILLSLLSELLRRVNRQTLEDHVQQLGAVQWAATGKLLADHNLLLSQSFVFMAKFLRQYETKPDSWHAAALHGHSLGKTFFITEPERRILKEMQLFSVSQIFETNDNMTTSEEEKVELFEHLDQHHPSLSNKLKWIRRNL
jgi:hypothetical protein